MRRRLSLVRREMQRRGFDAYITVQSVRYLSGTDAGKAVIVALDEDPVMICSRLELGRAKTESAIKNVIAFSSWKTPLMRGERVLFCEPWKIIVECLREAGARVIGFDVLSRETVRKMRVAHDASYRSAPDLVLEVRKVKFPDELALLRRSAMIASKGMRCAAECISQGISEIELAAEVEREMRRAGSDGTPFGTVVASGPNSWMPHAGAGDRRIRKGDLVVVDLGATYRGYASDMTRTFSVGASGKAEKLVQAVKKAQTAALKLVRDGKMARDVDGEARRVIGQAGYSRFCLHGSGHGVGLDIHELPSLSPVSKDVLKRNMVLTVEPGVYVPGLGGARWEDTVRVMKSGYSQLTVFR
ncbi:MAG: Xaa-Pro peptidase family protein [Candidatus Hadarchaeales archaeon]